MIRRPPRSTQSRSSAASDVYKRQGVAAVVFVYLLLFLAAGHRDLLRVYDHHAVARVHARSIDRLVLAAQYLGDLAREPPKDLALGIDQVPIPLYIGRLRRVCVLRELQMSHFQPC